MHRASPMNGDGLYALRSALEASRLDLEMLVQGLGFGLYGFTTTPKLWEFESHFAKCRAICGHRV